LDVSVPLINADKVWKIKDSYDKNITGQGITIAILDTGVDYTHPDLKDNYIQLGSYDFINNDTLNHAGN
jgi:minor extracellular serine protease Vpr